MQPAERTQTDGLGDEYSFETGLDCSNSKDMARHEQTGEADINKLLARFGIGIPQRQVVYGSMDFDLDLQQAYRAIETVKAAWDQMPDAITKKYTDWTQLAVALNSGELKFDPTKPAGSQLVIPEPAKPPEAPNATPDPGTRND